MKRLIPTTIALLLVTGSLGHLFAAAFCPRRLGHDCCLTKTASGAQVTGSHQHMPGMVMDTIADESMSMTGGRMAGMTTGVSGVPPSSLDINQGSPFSTSDELLPDNKLELPVAACPHCINHSGIQNAPVSSMSLRDQPGKNSGSVLLPAARLPTRPSIMPATIRLPGEHAPPGSSAPRHILINVFLI